MMGCRYSAHMPLELTQIPVCNFQYLIYLLSEHWMCPPRLYLVAVIITKNSYEGVLRKESETLALYLDDSEFAPTLQFCFHLQYVITVDILPSVKAKTLFFSSFNFIQGAYHQHRGPSCCTSPYECLNYIMFP